MVLGGGWLSGQVAVLRLGESMLTLCVVWGEVHWGEVH